MINIGIHPQLDTVITTGGRDGAKWLKIKTGSTTAAIFIDYDITKKLRAALTELDDE